MMKKLLSIFKKKKVENNYGYIKFEKGDEVKVTIFSEIPEFWYVGTILDINARYSYVLELNTETDNTVANNLYQSLGFELRGLKDDFNSYIKTL